MPVGTGYQIFVYYRATSGDAWGIYGYAPGTVNVTAAAFSAITVTAPTGTTTKAQGAAQPVSWTPNRRSPAASSASGWSSTASGWYVGKIVSATGAASYSDSVNLNVPVDTGYKIFVYYRATTGDAWASTATPRAP